MEGVELSLLLLFQEIHEIEYFVEFCETSLSAHLASTLDWAS